MPRVMPTYDVNGLVTQERPSQYNLKLTAKVI